MTLIAEQESGLERERRGSLRLTIYQKLLLIVFVLTVPLTNPWVRGDGVGYYAYARSLLIDRDLNFEKDWKHGNESFVMGRLNPAGHVLPDQYTKTGHIRNLWSIGASLLWLPFLAMTHAGVLIADKFGGHLQPNGFSSPYLISMAVATSIYGFAGLWLSFSVARKYFDERLAGLATLGIWWGTSLPVYMYFNPSWSHAHSAFSVALFIWYWHRTQKYRTARQWILLGLISALMVNVYYPNGVFLLLPLIEAASGYWNILKTQAETHNQFSQLFYLHLLYVCVFAIGLLPTLISRQIIFGTALTTGYMPVRDWKWSSPAFWSVLWSADHGVLSWTPIVILALCGLFLFLRKDKPFAAKLIGATVCFYCVISFYPDWDGLSSFGNRFFISLTPVFVLGLAAFFDRLAEAWTARRSRVVAVAMTCAFVVWNLGLIYQWGTHLIPARGPISWRQAAYNQVAVVPVEATRTLKSYLTRRGRLMQHIEEDDVRQLKSSSD